MPQILLFQIRYITPSRRAFAYLLPLASVARSHFSKAVACFRSLVSRTETIQSMDRPS